ncbi:hypothetical protein KKHLCK_02825 [Candidatus Electrothrix laxa]
MKKNLALLISFLILAGCSGKQIPPQSSTREYFKSNTNEEKALSDFKENYQKEWAIMPPAPTFLTTNSKQNLPTFGVALSGGGTRSANFCIGILKGLEENELLPEVQILSTVSGGSYAGYWLFSQQYHMAIDNINGMAIPDFLQYDTKTIFRSRDLFKEKCLHEDTKLKTCLNDSNIPSDPFCNNKRNKPEYRFQRHLEDRSDIAVRSVSPSLQALDYTIKGTSYLPSIFVSTFSELLFNWDSNVNPLRRYYQHGLERTYGFVPMEKIKNPCLTQSEKDQKDQNSFKTTYFMNDKGFIFTRAWAKDISFQELYNFTRNQNINYTQSKNKRHFPFWIINTSAKVEDENGDQVSDLSQRVFEFTPTSYGSNHFGYVNSPHHEISISKAVSISGAAVDNAGTSAFMGWLLDVLNADLGYNINNYSPEVEYATWQKVLPFPFYYWVNYKKDNKHHSIHLSDGGHSENLGAFSLIKRGVKNILIIDAEHDPEMSLQGLKRLATRLKKYEGLDLVSVNPVPLNYSAISANTGQVFKYKVTGFPFKDNDGSQYESNITYVKLSVNRNSIMQSQLKLPDTATPNYLSIINYMNKKEHKNKFPHHSTSDIQYSKYQVAAYRDLGYFIAKEQLTREKIFTNEIIKTE